MFDEIKLIEIGFVKKAHRNNGEVKVNFSNDFDIFTIDNYKKLPVFFKISGLVVPFFIDYIRNSGLYFIIKFNLINSSEEAQKIVSKKILIQESKYNNSKESLLSYKVTSKKHGFLGIISQIDEIPNNPIIVIRNHERKTNLLIPYRKNFIEYIDHENKTVKIIPPDGLIELYL